MRPGTAAETKEVTGSETILECRKMNREVKKKLKVAKEEWTEEQ